MKILCWIKSIFRSLPQIINGELPISGHLLVDEEYHTGCNVTISKCEVCEEIHITWSGGREVYSRKEFIGEHYL